MGNVLKLWNGKGDKMKEGKQVRGGVIDYKPPIPQVKIGAGPKPIK